MIKKPTKNESKNQFTFKRALTNSWHTLHMFFFLKAPLGLYK